MRTAPLTVASLLALLSHGCICLDSCAAPERFPRSSAITALEGPRPALLYHMYSNSGTLFAALILQPVGSAVGWNKSSFSVECTVASETLGWNHPQGHAELVMSYSVREKRVRLANHSFSTSEGNTFLISLDDTWRPTASPLLLAAGGSSQDTLARIQTALAQDSDVTALRATRH